MIVFPYGHDPRSDPNLRIHRAPGSFHAASVELGLTQPSVSQRVRELETTLNTPLFIRRGPRVSLTAEGHALIDHARRLLDDATSIVARFRDRDPLRGLLRLGLNESFAMTCLPDLLQLLIEQHPDRRPRSMSATRRR